MAKMMRGFLYRNIEQEVAIANRDTSSTSDEKIKQAADALNSAKSILASISEKDYRTLQARIGLDSKVSDAEVLSLYYPFATVSNLSMALDRAVKPRRTK